MLFLTSSLFLFYSVLNNIKERARFRYSILLCETKSWEQFVHRCTSLCDLFMLMVRSFILFNAARLIHHSSFILIWLDCVIHIYNSITSYVSNYVIHFCMLCFNINFQRFSYSSGAAEQAFLSLSLLLLRTLFVCVLYYFLSIQLDMTIIPSSSVCLWCLASSNIWVVYRPTCTVCFDNYSLHHITSTSTSQYCSFLSFFCCTELHCYPK